MHTLQNLRAIYGFRISAMPAEMMSRVDTGAGGRSICFIGQKVCRNLHFIKASQACGYAMSILLYSQPPECDALRAPLTTQKTR